MIQFYPYVCAFVRSSSVKVILSRRFTHVENNSDDNFLCHQMVKQKVDIAVNHPCIQLNPSMRLIFDILTPRPHFIILHREEHRKLNPTDNEMKDIMELVTHFLTYKKAYDNNNAILSFHRGKWYQRNIKHFHAHLCVSRKPYCDEAKATVRKISLDFQIN